MSDPRNVAHDKKVAQEKKRHGAEATAEEIHAVQTGKKPAATHKETVAAVSEPAVADIGLTPKDTPPELEGSLTVLSKLKGMEFHSRATLERLAEMTLTVADELKQSEFAEPVGELYTAQDVVQTMLTTLIMSYQAECDRMQGASV